jgi:hypothetical protein
MAEADVAETGADHPDDCRDAAAVAAGELGGVEPERHDFSLSADAVESDDESFAAETLPPFRAAGRRIRRIPETAG